MVAIAYENLGGIHGVTTSPKVPSSMRSRDRNAVQRIAFNADTAKPFTGILHIQASVDDPTDASGFWFDIVEMDVDDEGGTWSVETTGEFSSIRVICKNGNYWASKKGSAGTSVTSNGDFTINGITIAVSSGDTPATVVNKINATVGIAAAKVSADIFSTDIVRISTTDGSDLTLVDGTNTPLNNLGFSNIGTVAVGGIIQSIKMLR